MRDPRRTEGSHGAWQKGANNRGRCSDRCGIVMGRVCGFCRHLRREAVGSCGGMGQRITKETRLCSSFIKKIYIRDFSFLLQMAVW